MNVSSNLEMCRSFRKDFPFFLLQTIHLHKRTLLHIHPNQIVLFVSSYSNKRVHTSFSSHQTIDRKSSSSILLHRPFIYLSVASVSYVPSKVYESAIECDSMSDCRKISLNASGCLTPKKRIPKIRNNVREPMMIPQTPMANRNREMSKSTMYRPRNVKSDSPILEFSKRETTGVGASMATHIMTRQTTVMIDPTRTSRYRARKMKLIETAIFKAYSKAERVRKDRVRRCFEDMLLFCSIFVVIEIAV
mmetsp:Transcript_40918/g.97967  ORF Transcript_40918/g.97967 Transcript_40918/m.97967 type:complete len:248 (-) Transcript_40918:269-1012(-)